MSDSKLDPEDSLRTILPVDSDNEPYTTERLSIPEAKAPKSPEEGLSVGTIFAGRYLILEELGKGGMGKVYKVLDQAVAEKVAMKLLNPSVASDEKTIERFRNELKLARRISHRNICRMYDLSKVDETHYITMEFVPGEDLKSSIKRMGPLSPGKAIMIAKQICEGLTEAHRLGVVHRDLKPQNIMIDTEGNVRIMDFGIARSLEKKGITETGIIIGTPEYMSVEQVEGKEADQRSDIYSLGVILYEMVTGKVPFGGDTPLSIAVKHTTQNPEDPREINSQIPEELSRAILTCMEKDKEKRYQSAEQLLSELDKVEKNIPHTQKFLPLKKHKGTTEITVSFRLKNIFIPAVAFVLIAIFGIISWQWFSQKETVLAHMDKPSLTVLRFENRSEDRSLDHWRSGISQLLITGLGQSKLLRVPSGESVWEILERLNLSKTEYFTSSDLKKVATLAKTDHILSGSFSLQGEDFILIAILQDPHTGHMISSRRVRCQTKGEIPAKIDELANQIKLDMGISPNQLSGDINKNLTMVVTGSPEAYIHYIKGWENHVQRGNPYTTIDYMKKATASDPEFAEAYSMMAEAYSQLDLILEMWECLQKASGLRDRLSLREFYLVQGRLFGMTEETYGKAIDSYSRLLDIYPEDWEGNYNLGVLLGYHLEQWRKAAQRFEVLLQTHQGTVEPYLQQAEAYMALGMYDKARQVLEAGLTNFPGEVRLKEKMSTSYICQRRLNPALKQVEEALFVNQDSVHPLLLGDIYHYQGELDWAEQEYQRIISTKEGTDRCYGRFRLAALYFTQGRLQEAEEQLKQIWAWAEEVKDTDWIIWSHAYLAQLHLSSGDPEQAKIEWERAYQKASEHGVDWQTCLHLNGLIRQKMKSMDEARSIAEELKKTLLEKPNQKLMRYYYHLLGMMDLEEGNLPNAIKHFKKALTMLSFQHSGSDDHALFVYPLALAYYQSGDLESAQEQYRKMTSLTTGRLFYGAMFAKSFYMLGRIYQEKGQEEKAKKHYARFIELWKDADPGMPEVEDAIERLAQLESVT